MAVRTGALPDALIMYEEIVRMALLYKEEGGGWQEELEALYEYALFLRRQGNDRRALEVCALLDSFYDPEDPDPDQRDNRARLNNLMGQIYMGREEYEDAEARFRASLDLYRALADEGEDAEPEVAELCGRLAEVMEATFRHGAAARLALEALSRYFRLEREEPGDYTQELAEACRRLAPYLDGRKYVHGTPPFGRAREFNLCMDALFDCTLDRDGAHGAERSVALDTLAGLIPELAFPDEGARLLREAEDEARKKMEEADHPASYEAALAAICVNKARDLLKENRLEDAEVLARRVVELYELLAGADPCAYEAGLAKSYHGLGAAIARTCRPKESEAVYRKALEIRKRLAKENPAKYEGHVASTCYNLAMLLHECERSGEAEEYCRESLDIFRRLTEQDPGSHAVDMLRVYYDYGILLDEVRRPAEAEQLYREGLEFHRRHGSGDFDGELTFAIAKSSLAGLLGQTGRPEEAETLYKEALNSLRNLAAQNPGAAEILLATVCNNYAAFLMDSRRNPAAAVPLLEEAVALNHKYPQYQKNEAISHAALSMAKQLLWEQQGLRARYEGRGAGGENPG